LVGGRFEVDVPLSTKETRCRPRHSQSCPVPFPYRSRMRRAIFDLGIHGWAVIVEIGFSLLREILDPEVTVWRCFVVLAPNL
jgi:hypothetical protein